MDNLIIWGNDTMDVSGELLSQSLDGDFTKASHTKKSPPGFNAPNTAVVFYGIVKTPEWFKFDEDRMFCNPANSRKLLKRSDVLANLARKGCASIKYYALNNDTNYSRLRDVLGATFDLVSKSGMKVVGTVSNSKEYAKLRTRAQFACKHYPKTVSKYRVYLGHPDVTPVLGATFSEHRTLSFRETVMFDSTEETRAHVESLFEQGILQENMGKGFKAWTEEKHLAGKDLTGDANYSKFDKLSSVVSSLYNVDYCAVDVIFSDKDMVVTNVTAFPSLQADDVLAFVSEYFKKLAEEGRKITPEHIAKLVGGMQPEQLDIVAKLLKKALAA